MKFISTPVRGTRDFLPTEMEVRSAVSSIILSTYKNNGFQQIKTPILENLELLCSGDKGDNQKLMFKTIKRGEKLDLTKQNLTESDICEEGLRYDLTVPLARFFCGNREKLTYPFKSCQIDESFRAERPQRGRERQFTQCDIDIFGDNSCNAEIDIILTILSAYKNVGLSNLTVKVSDRRLLNQILNNVGFDEKDYVSICISLDKIDKIGIDGVERELINKEFDTSKIKTFIETIKNIKENGMDCLSKLGISESVVNNLKTIIDVVSLNSPADCKAVFDISIVRGQGYYTGTVYETYVDGYNFSGAIGGGGRYDNMIEKFSGQPVCAVGYGLGLEPVVLIMLETKKTFSINPKLALIYDDLTSSNDIFKIKNELKSQFDVSIFAYPKNLSNLLNKLQINNFKKFAIIRQNVLKEIKDI